MAETGPVLGIEGTAWNLSASVFDDSLLSLVSHAYAPPSGGIHPREAAQHHASYARAVISEALEKADVPISAVAFSQGPGLGPCLRVVATAARALAVSKKIPLIGVNHCIAHIEIGRFASGFEDPIVLYASGANTQVLGYLNGRYRIFGETLDIGIGNALDKFARSKNLAHPGGPKVELHAKGGRYIPLPYTVKGMDLAFSGLMSAAKDAKGSLEDVCYSFQETAFAMCTEVSERALAQTNKDELILVGGVGANKRLQEMLHVMCEERGASCFAPEMKYLGDNGAMIAYTGRLMQEAGMTLSVEDSVVRPGFRADQAEVPWRKEGKERESESQAPCAQCNDVSSKRGAEALVTEGVNAYGMPVITKKRVPKRYRINSLDEHLILDRTKTEARLLSEARRAGVRTPVLSDVSETTLEMEQIFGSLLKEALCTEHLFEAGRVIGKLHRAGIVHGDLTTCNMIVERRTKNADDENSSPSIALIDFGLAHMTTELEPRGVDLHVLFQILSSTSAEHESLKSAFCAGYTKTAPDAILAIAREEEICERGRYL
ncbi:MAG: bifunctional N(6)-L-threonylcarbamoyladenine synthase/serine/threonine protein kinase [Methanomicrobiales archaeon]|nr:bifunctional N(6)-L-threonylcarbamoyladenine synthase/serine/threonine protein kinase [Methanomicrobiales archaeon]